jgi:glucose/arabinose dehydrogenase
MALEGTYYGGNADGVSVFQDQDKLTQINMPGRKLVDFNRHGHLTRSLIVAPAAPAPCRRRIAQQHRRDRQSGRGRAGGDLGVRTRLRSGRIFASGRRNSVGMRWEPSTRGSVKGPVGVTTGLDKRSLLMADDVSDLIWRVPDAL